MKNRHIATESITNDSQVVAVNSGLSRWESNETSVEDFIESMPERYRQEFGSATARQHAHVSATRGKRTIHADLFNVPTTPEPALCVVATDAPGLLAAISTGLMLEGFDITRADAYTRRTPTRDYEAVDLFWVRRASAERSTPLGDADVYAVLTTLRDLLSHGNVNRRLQRSLAGTSPGASETSVRFHDVRGVPWLKLELESNDRPGLLAVVTAALAAEGVQIVDSRIRTYGLRVHDYFDLIESDGTRLTGTRLQRLQLAVLAAVDGPNYGA